MSLSLFKSLIPKRAKPAPHRAGVVLDKERLQRVRKFAKSVGIPMGDGAILNEALTHKSYAHERGIPPSYNNEKLEFLGDSVLGLVIAQHVFESFPDVTEGALSRVKSVIVSAQVLSEKAVQIHLGEYLWMGKGEERSGGRQRPGLLADAIEAVIGAAYLVGGLESAGKFVLSLLRDDVENVFTGKMEKDYKTLLQEHVQKTQRTAPRYEIVKEWGPDHNRNFEAACSVHGKIVAHGVGKNKKEAEQNAAEEAVRRLRITVSTPSDLKI